jgi:hypothetical protein
MRASFEEMSGEAVTQRVNFGGGNVQLLAGDDQQALQGGARHGSGRLVHALGQGLWSVVTATDIGKEEERMSVKDPVALEFAPQAGGQGNDAILVTFAITNEELVLGALDIVDGQSQTLTQSQAAGIDEFERSAIAAQADEGQEIVDLSASENSGQSIMILGADLGEDRPVGVAEQIEEEQARGGEALTDGLWLPVLGEFDEDEVVAQLILGKEGGIAGEVIVDEADLTVVGVACAIGVVAQGQLLGESRHGGIGMVVVDGVDEIPWSGTNGGGRRWRGWRTRRVAGLGRTECLGVLNVFGMNGMGIGIFHTPRIVAVCARPSPGQSKRSRTRSTSPRSGLVQPSAPSNRGSAPDSPAAPGAGGR